MRETRLDSSKRQLEEENEGDKAGERVRNKVEEREKTSQQLNQLTVLVYYFNLNNNKIETNGCELATSHGTIKFWCNPEFP